MINKRALLILAVLILLTLSACLPQIEPDQAPQAVDTATNPPPFATPPLATPPLATHPTKELIMPKDPTEKPTIEEPTEPAAVQGVSQPTAESTRQPGVQNWVNQAKEDLAQRLKISSAEIELLSFETKVWPDAGLGCPQPGMVYAQVIVEGYLIRLTAGDQTYNYHGGGNRAPFLCEQPGPEIIITKRTPLDIKQTPTKSVPPPRD